MQNATTEYRVRMTLCGGTLQPSVKLLITLEGTYYHPRDRCRVPNADCESCIQTISAASLDSTHPHPHVHISRIRTEPCEYGPSRESASHGCKGPYMQMNDWHHERTTSRRRTRPSIVHATVVKKEPITADVKNYGTKRKYTCSAELDNNSWSS